MMVARQFFPPFSPAVHAARENKVCSMRASSLNRFLDWIQSKLVHPSVSLPEIKIHGYRFSPLREMEIWFTWQTNSIIIHMYCEWRSEISPKMQIAYRDALRSYNSKIFTGAFEIDEQKNRLVYRGSVCAYENVFPGTFNSMFDEAEKYGSKYMALCCPPEDEEAACRLPLASEAEGQERRYAVSSLVGAEIEKWHLPVAVSRASRRYQPLHLPDNAVGRGVYCDMIMVEPNSCWRVPGSAWKVTNEPLTILVTCTEADARLFTMSHIVCLKDCVQTIDVYEPWDDDIGVLTSYYLPRASGAS